MYARNVLKTKICIFIRKSKLKATFKYLKYVIKTKKIILFSM